MIRVLVVDDHPAVLLDLHRPGGDGLLAARRACTGRPDAGDGELGHRVERVLAR